MRVLITRPPQEALPYIEAAEALGGTASCLPLFSIEPVTACLPDLSAIRSLIFTSAHGVAGFCALEQRRDWPVFVVGPQTAQAAREAGFARISIAPGGNAESMIGLIGAADAPLFYGRARDAAFPVREALAAEGVEVRETVLYEARVMSLPDRWEGADVVLFFSARGARIFVEYIVKQGFTDNLARTKALCLGAGMVESLSVLPWQAIETADFPDRAGMLALLNKNMTSQDQDR